MLLPAQRAGVLTETILLLLALRLERQRAEHHDPLAFLETAHHFRVIEIALTERDDARMEYFLRAVAREHQALALTHRTLRWRGAKPKTGLPAAARQARYRLLAQAARAAGATHVLTAHTRDDQAETLLMRLLRGSGIAGLSAMARVTMRDGIVLARPLLDVPKSQLIATLKRAKLGFADDPTNRDTTFTRPRLRALLPQLAAEGGDARNLVRLAGRLSRANAAVEVLTDGAERFLRLRDRGDAPHGPGARSFEAAAFATLPEEVRLRLLQRAIDALGHEGPAELGKVETLLAALDQAILDQAMDEGRRSPAKGRPALKQTLAGALISLAGGRIHVAPAPARRSKSGRGGGS